MKYSNDLRTVMTLDAGGTNFVFGAISAFNEIMDPIHLPSAANNLELCLANIKNGFHAVRSRLQEKGIAPVAISFAFPGPADYKNGIIGDLGNLPAFRGGVALGPMLEEEFGIPVFVNNDGDLYAYGEAIAGFLPFINSELEKAGSPRRYKNLVGLTLGTGFGGGLVCDGNLYIGDNCSGMEVWTMSQRYCTANNIEENISIRAVKRAYAEATGTTFENAPNPKDIFDISTGAREGNKQAALEAFHKMGRALGDALCNILTMTDTIAVIGGGVAGAREVFLPSAIEEMNSNFEKYGNPRLTQKIYNLDNSVDLEEFTKGSVTQITIPGSSKTVTYDPVARIGFGFSQIGTSKAISVGAYAYALSQIDKN